MKLEYKNNKRPFKPSLPNVLKPSKLLLPTDFTETCLLQLFGTHNTLDCIRQASPASFGKSPKLPKLQNTLYILNRCVLCLGTNLLSMGITMGEGRRMSSSQWERQCCRNLSQGFSLNSHLTHFIGTMIFIVEYVRNMKSHFSTKQGLLATHSHDWNES